MWHVKVRDNGHWREIFASVDLRTALAIYNAAPVPKMFLGHSPHKSGVLHKQYTDNGFVYEPDWSREND